MGAVTTYKILPISYYKHCRYKGLILEQGHETQAIQFAVIHDYLHYEVGPMLSESASVQCISYLCKC